MTNALFFKNLKTNFLGVFIAITIGVIAYTIRITTKASIADPLLIALLFGIILRAIIGENTKLKIGFAIASKVFIPFGIIFYSMKNLNFTKFAEVDSSIIILLIVIIFVYFSTIFILGKFLNQKKKIISLTATGGAICGASAIAITSPAVEAEPDDVSISLLATAVVGLIGLFIIMPFLATFFDLTGKTYALFSGSVLRFTGFVKAAVVNATFLDNEIPMKEMVAFALSIKAVRYIGLLIAIPLFASIVKKKFYIPWVLWMFLVTGAIGSWIYAINEVYYSETLIPFIKPIYGVAWSIAMGAIGLNADIKQLLSNNGAKALVMAFGGFISAIIAFFIMAKIFDLI